MACSSVAPCALAPTLVSTRAASATRAGPASLRAPALLRGTPFLGGKLARSVQGSNLRRSRPASIARAQAVSTSAPKTATKGDSDDLWLKLHGVDNWAGLLPTAENGEKIEETLKNEIIKYGEMAQLTYDSVDLYEWSRYRAQNRFTKEVNGQKVPSDLFGENLVEKSFFEHLPGQGYEAVAYMYASEETKVFKAVKKPEGQDIREDVWIGYIAYSKTKRDIVVAWRGTQQPAEWVADAEVGLMSYMKYDPAGHKDPPQTGGVPIKLGYAALAFLGATGWGALSAAVIAFAFYVIFTLLKSESVLGDVYNGASGAVAALPISKFFPKYFPGFFTNFFPEVERDGKVGKFVTAYAAAVAALTVVANLVTSPDQFWNVWTVDSLIFALFVLLPTGATAAVEAWESADEGPQVHEGFYELYDPTGDKAKMPKTTGKYPRRVVHETVEKLLRDHPDTRTISVTGHSLGGALAVLSAYDIVESGCNVTGNGKSIPVACFAFEAPRVGNPQFKDSFEANKAKGLAAIRVVNKPDIVTQVPKAFYLQNVYYLLAAITNNDYIVNIINQVEELGYKLKLPSAFQHVAPDQELVHDSREVDYLKKMPGFNPLNNTDAIGFYHNLEVNLHMVSGYWSNTFTRDFALCNKSADVIDPRTGVPPLWFMPVIPTVVRSKGRAIIEPYSKELPPLDGEDNNRKIGQGPVAKTTKKCEPLIRDYLEKYDPPEETPAVVKP